MTRYRIAGLSVLLVAAVLAVGCISYHRGGHSHGSHLSYEAWVYGSTVRLGGGYYQVLYHPRSHSHYLRTRRLKHHRRHCTRYCYSDAGYHYHHAGCRHLGRHVRRLGVTVDALIRDHGPRYRP